MSPAFLLMEEELEVQVAKILHPIDLEDIFDFNEFIEAKIESTAENEKIYFQILVSIRNKNYKDSIELCEKLFFLSEDRHDKLIALQWAVAVSEVVYDMSIREKWMKRWHSISNWNQDYWAQYLYLFQLGLTYFFQGHLSEAEINFNECLSLAIKNNYDRGIIRSYHHLGLIARDYRQYEVSKNYLILAHQKAKESSRLRMAQIIQGELSSLNLNFQFNLHSKKLITFLKDRRFKDARCFIRNIQKLRKSENRFPERDSENVLLSIFFFVIDKHKSLSIVYQRLIDPVVKMKTLEIFKQFRNLSQEMDFEYQFLLKKFNQNKKPEFISKDSSIKRSLTTEELRFIHLLSCHPQGLTKEQIAISLWKQSYDPLYHDPKIYKIVLSCRKESLFKQRLLNKYGIYLLAAQ